MILGALIDSSCRLWQTDDSNSSPTQQCDGEQHSRAARGSCLLFDTDQLRWRTYGLVLAVQVVQLIFSLLLYGAVRRRRFTEPAGGDDAQDRMYSKSAVPRAVKQSAPSAGDSRNVVEMTQDQQSVKE